MKIVFLGSGKFGIDCIEAIAESNNQIKLVVTSPPNPAGRGQKQKPTPVAQWAKQNNIKTIETDNVNTPEMIKSLASFEPDLVVVIAFGQKISNDLIAIPPKGAINVHASLLPKYRGAAPINFPVINGDTQTGVTIITLAEKMDAGKMLARAKTDIAPDEDAGQLHDRLAKIAAPLLLETIDKIAAGTAEYIEQDHSKATLAPKLKKSDGILDFTDSAIAIERKIRGLWPWPKATAAYTSKKTGKTINVAIAKAKVVETTSNLAPGTLDENLNIVCGTDALEILQIKPAGRQLQSFKDFLNGQHCQPDDLFKKIEL
ncbi:MAG: methionyl-tRNA formyltransferase [Planctomycetes bacterium]|nr:methionyl-tRNA formyltransferase [Planctomycetota bacterium]